MSYKQNWQVWLLGKTFKCWRKTFQRSLSRPVRGLRRWRHETSGLTTWAQQCVSVHTGMSVDLTWWASGGLLGVISVLLYGPWGSNLSHQGSWQSHVSSEPSCYLQMCFNSALFHSIQLLEYVWDISQAHLTSEYSNLKNYQWHT